MIHIINIDWDDKYIIQKFIFTIHNIIQHSTNIPKLTITSSFILWTKSPFQGYKKSMDFEAFQSQNLHYRPWSIKLLLDHYLYIF